MKLKNSAFGLKIVVNPKKPLVELITEHLLRSDNSFARLDMMAEERSDQPMLLVSCNGITPVMVMYHIARN